MNLTPFIKSTMISKLKNIALVTAFLGVGKVLAQQPTQTIKGTVIDKQSQAPLQGVKVMIVGSEPLKGAVSGPDGKFKIEELVPQRYELVFRFTGYQEIVLPNIQLTAGKEVELDVAMEEMVKQLNELSVSATKKNETINQLTSVSSRSFSMEEVNRYAGGRSDPSRLAANFAGVSTPDDSRNDIVIRGNSPTGVLWRIEGLNIPNPNHFSTIGTTGGPISGLNTNMLRNSDFFTSAFPAEYGNANAGVFDLGFRNGNADRREHTLQFGMLTGIEANTEGPIRKEKGSSYALAYRYSFTGVAQAIGLNIGTTATPFYQDLSWKVNSGKTKWGKFTLFGLAGLSRIEFLHDKIDTTDLFAIPNRDSYFVSRIGLVGISHTGRVNEKSYFKTVAGATYSGSSYDEDTSNVNLGSVYRVIENTTTQLRYIVNTSYNWKLSSRWFFKFGAIEELINLKLFYRNRNWTPDWLQIWDYNDFTSLMQGYAHAKWSVSDQLVVNAGLHAQYLSLNGAFALEPRLGAKYKIHPKHQLSVGAGLHAQMQPIDVYFYRTQLADGSYEQSNLDLDFTRSVHSVLAWDWSMAKDWRLKLETYYQYLYAVPVDDTLSSYSMLNSGAGFTPNEHGYLVNKGTGTNYGLELTIEKFFSKGYYALLTGSLYESTYEGSDGKTRKTAFNGQFVYNLLIGKEFKFGKNKQNAFTCDFKFTHAGGRYYTPIDLEKSKLLGREIRQGDEFAYTERVSDFLRIDVKAGFTFNSQKYKVTHAILFELLNATNNKNVFAERYNPNAKTINTAYQLGVFPNLIYRFQF